MGICDNNKIQQPQINIDKNNVDDLEKQNPKKIEYVFPGNGTHIPDE